MGGTNLNGNMTKHDWCLVLYHNHLNMQKIVGSARFASLLDVVKCNTKEQGQGTTAYVRLVLYDLCPNPAEKI